MREEARLYVAVGIKYRDLTLARVHIVGMCGSTADADGKRSECEQGLTQTPLPMNLWWRLWYIPSHGFQRSWYVRHH